MAVKVLPASAACLGLGACLGAGITVLVVARVPAQPLPHDIAYYVANDDARAVMTKRCQSDHRFDQDPDCANAETAGLQAYADRLRKSVQK